MNADELMQIIEDTVIEIDDTKKLPCVEAFEIAKKHDVPLKEIGDACNKVGIKIISCQLGCF
jgi:hypothetical protein